VPDGEEILRELHAPKHVLEVYRKKKSRKNRNDEDGVDGEVEWKKTSIFLYVTLLER
jgi:hypothetical protein